MRVFIAFVLLSVFVVFSFFVEKEELPKIVVKSPFVYKFDCEKRKDCLILAQAIYHEGRGESAEGQIAIAHVILNRVGSSKFPNSVKEVVEQPRQFSYLDNGAPRWYDDLKSYEKAKYIASMVLQGLTDDPTNGSTFYLNLKKVKRIPRWTKVFNKKITIGNHTFYG